MSLSGKTALITGAGRGIGRSVAERLAKEGARVVVLGRTASEIEEVAASLNGVAVRADVGDRASLSQALAELSSKKIRVDVLVNNAGIADSAPLSRTTDAMWDAALAVNVTSAFGLCRALVPPMVDSGWGRVVNVA